MEATRSLFSWGLNRGISGLAAACSVGVERIARKVEAEDCEARAR
jgi:N-acyl-L-homoserine lactone synthetase